MARQLTIIGIGEALLVEKPDRNEAAGLAASVARQAVRFGHVGVAISRVGQDPQAETLLALLAGAGADTSHMQSDPDLPTGRVTERALGGPVARYLDDRAAFDNLQSDFDLEDIAQQADAVVFGLLTRRGGQTRAEEDRFLGAASAAFRLLDLTNRVDGTVDRGQAQSGLVTADAAIFDTASIGALHAGGDTPAAQAEALLRVNELSLAVLVDGEVQGGIDEGVQAGDDRTTRVTMCTSGECVEGELPGGRLAMNVARVALLDRLLGGHSLQAALDLAARTAKHAAEKPDEPVPSDWLA